MSNKKKARNGREAAVPEASRVTRRSIAERFGRFCEQQGLPALDWVEAAPGGDLVLMGSADGADLAMARAIVDAYAAAGIITPLDPGDMVTLQVETPSGQWQTVWTVGGVGKVGANTPEGIRPALVMVSIRVIAPGTTPEPVLDPAGIIGGR